MTAQRTAAPIQLSVGLDIAAKTFAAAWLTPTAGPTPARTWPQTPAGFAAIQAELRATGVAPAATRVVLEATSSYWVALAVTLHQAGFVGSLVNPAQVHNYAKSLPRRSKTDALDAQLLAQFAAERQPAQWTPPPTVYHELRQRLVARDGLLEMRRVPSG
jgi:transposase